MVRSGTNNPHYFTTGSLLAFIIHRFKVRTEPKIRYCLGYSSLCLSMPAVFTHTVQGGPLLVASRVITPINSLITGVITPLITGRGPPCMI